MKISLFFILLFSFSVQASPPPCTVWQVKVRTHPVEKYKREDGAEYSKTNREKHCREKFKAWNQTEKEDVLRALSTQARVLRELSHLV